MTSAAGVLRSGVASVVRPAPVPRATLWHCLLRLFLLQAAWNFERMQHVGFAAALLPALRRLYPSREGLRAALMRHVEFFNTHPYMAAPIAGATVRMEEDVAAGNRAPDEARQFAAAVMGSCGAIGDALFWGALRPMLATVAVALALAGRWESIVVFLLLYNAAHLTTRVAGFFAGYAHGPAVVHLLRGLELPRRAGQVTMAGVGALAAVVVVVATRHAGGDGGVALGLALVLGVFLSAGAARRGLSVERQVLLLLGGATLVALFRG